MRKDFFIIKISVLSFALFALYTGFAFAISGCGEDANPGIRTICDIITLFQGRIGRSIATFSIMICAWSFLNGNFNWQQMVQLAIGIGVFMAPKTFALFLLPDYIEGLSGDGFDTTTRYSPDEIITCVCPNLR